MAGDDVGVLRYSDGRRVSVRTRLTPVPECAGQPGCPTHRLVLLGGQWLPLPAGATMLRVITVTARGEMPSPSDLMRTGVRVVPDATVQAGTIWGLPSWAVIGAGLVWILMA